MVSPIFQPRFGEDTYPIGRFILERSRALALSRTDLVRRLGYSDIRSGHEALNAVLLRGSVAPHLTNYLADALEADRGLVGAVTDATNRQTRDEARLDRTLWKLNFGLPFNVTGDQTGATQKVERLGQATLGTRRGDTRLTGLLKDSPIQAIRVPTPTQGSG